VEINGNELLPPRHREATDWSHQLPATPCSSVTTRPQGCITELLASHIHRHYPPVSASQFSCIKASQP